MITISDGTRQRQSLAKIVELIIKIVRDYNSVMDECTLINTRRIFYLAMIAIPLRVVNIFLFAFTSSYDTPVLRKWSQGIVGSHFLLLIFMIAFLLISNKNRNETKPNISMNILQYITAIVIMVSGIAIVTIDQMITSNITPFILICIVTGSVFLFRPISSFLLYVFSYIIYYYSMVITTTNQEVLLSNRVNGITAIGIGFLLSIIMWRNNYTNIAQKRRIETQQKQLEQMAYYDPLTDLPNRRLFDKLVNQELSLMQQQSHESVVIILDIDDFKNINDTFGHPVGDRILMQLAELLKNNVRESDTVSRFGGEEFIILMPKASVEEGFVFAERLRKMIIDKKFVVGSNALQITSSFGVSSLVQTKDHRPVEYYYYADQALYLAKQQGKNRVEKMII